MWLPHVLDRNRLIRPDATALTDTQQQVTWRQLSDRTDALACALLRAGVSRGERILILSANRMEIVELYFAITKAGAVACPVNPSLQASEIRYIVANVRPVATFAESMALDRLQGASSGWIVTLDTPRYEEMANGPTGPLTLPHQADAAVIFNTSATTGRPKAVVVTHRSLMATYVGMAAATGMSDVDVMINPCPLFHASTVVGLALLAAGGHLVIERDFTPQRFLADVERFRATRAYVVPSMIHFVLAARTLATSDLSSLQELMHGGAPMTHELRRQARAKLPCKLRCVYGSTEGGSIAFLASDEAQPRSACACRSSSPSVGRMMPGVQVAVMDAANQPLPAGEIGEICVRSDGMMDEYWENDEATATATAQGWLHTGDLGCMDEDGYIFLLDRKSDLIIRAGLNVYPAEIERVLAEQPGVAEAVALGVPSVEWGEVPVAFVVPDAGRQPDVTELFAACERELAKYKRPTAIHVIEEIPRSASGKMLRRLLRERLLAQAAATGLPVHL